MGRIEADIALESWLFGFRPCSGQGQFTYSQEPCEWVDVDLEILWEESEQKLPLKVVCSNFSPVRESAVHPFLF